jgi:hypothetical protein
MKLRDVNRFVLAAFAVTATVWLVLFMMKPARSDSPTNVRWATLDDRDGGPALADPNAPGMPWSLPGADDPGGPTVGGPLALPREQRAPDDVGAVMRLATSGRRTEQLVAEEILRERVESGHATPRERALFRGLCHVLRNCDGDRRVAPARSAP